MILLFSGGLDSYIAYHYLEEPKTLYVDLGHRYADKEKEVVNFLLPWTIIDRRLNLGDWEEEDANIPMRNAFLVMIAAKYDPNVVLVVQKGETDVPDRTKSFFREMNTLVAQLTSIKFNLSSPFFNVTKTQMVKWYLSAGHSVDKLLKTRSCYSTTKKPCGACSACFRRWVALTNNGLSEEYENPILEYDGIPKYIKKMEEGLYDPQRTFETLNALRIAGYTK